MHASVSRIICCTGSSSITTTLSGANSHETFPWARPLIECICGAQALRHCCGGGRPECDSTSCTKKAPGPSRTRLKVGIVPMSGPIFTTDAVPHVASPPLPPGRKIKASPTASFETCFWSASCARSGSRTAHPLAFVKNGWPPVALIENDSPIGVFKAMHRTLLLLPDVSFKMRLTKNLPLLKVRMRSPGWRSLILFFARSAMVISASSSTQSANTAAMTLVKAEPAPAPPKAPKAIKPASPPKAGATTLTATRPPAAAQNADLEGAVALCLGARASRSPSGMAKSVWNVPALKLLMPFTNLLFTPTGIPNSAAI
mmetsp:Transcript_2112/g.6233  ORF Transcript_2112/g.6233 Transcript_2112/m.6233 type:complete len:315 (+) Transcript_2112:257-1201(+)